MIATREVIEGWLDRLYADPNVTHMIVKCDEFDFSDYPIFVTADQDVRKVARENSDRTMEVYSANHTREEQLAVRRAHNYD